MTIHTFTKKELKRTFLKSDHSSTKYPWYKIEVGGGFFIPKYQIGNKAGYVYAPPAARKAGMKFKSETCSLNNTQGLLVTRVA